MDGKRVTDSRLTVVSQMTAQDANLAGHVHGGEIVKHIDNTAAIVAIRHTNCNYLIFVALDPAGKATRVPPLVLETDEEKRRNEQARLRRQFRSQECKLGI